MTLKTYDCTVLFDASANITVQAESPEEAARIAEEQTDGHQRLCHQCSDTLDTGDITGVLVYEGLTEVADTTHASELLAKARAQHDEMLDALRLAAQVNPFGDVGNARARDAAAAIVAKFDQAAINKAAGA